MRYSKTGATGVSVRADTVENALLAVGQGISQLGAPDPRKQVGGGKQYHPLLASFLKGLRDKDDPASRSYPANVTIIRALYDALDICHQEEGQLNRTTIDLIIVAFYWLLRPAEYLDSGATGRSQAFKFEDICLTAGGRVYRATDTSLNDVNETDITFATLTFTDQKNAVRGEQVGHKANSDPLLCPCKALYRLTDNLRRHRAPPKTPIFASYKSRTSFRNIKPTYVTNALRHAANSIRHITGIDPKLLSARSLRPGGATALLCAGIDPNSIQLLGRWRSDAMLRYLRIQAHTHASNFSQRMLDHGSYTFAPGVYTAANDQPLPQQTPADFLAVLHHEELADDA